MNSLGLLLALCGTLCWAQMEQLEPFNPPVGIGETAETVENEEHLVRCKRPLCDIECAYGRVLGEDGCATCTCKTPEDICKDFGECSEGERCHVPTCFGEFCETVSARCITECPMLKCMACESGIYLNDERGCQTCDCGPEQHPCAIPMCGNRCENGYANNEFGCMTCKCNPEPNPMANPELSADISDEDGSDEDISDEDLPVLPEVPEGCSRAMCRMFCEDGFETDERGCEVCRCRSQPIPEPSQPTPEHACPEVMCLMFCEHGFEKDELDCNMCTCRSNPVVACPAAMCSVFCENGFEKNELGCDTCKCKLPRQEDICAPIDCVLGLNCHLVTPSDCVGCSPVPLCRPTSICQLHEGQTLEDDEIDMMMHHLQPSEMDRFFPGPAKCRRDGSFEPKQCFEGQCFCVDDRGVMQQDSLGKDEQQMECYNKITKVLNLSFQLEHDLDDNDLDGALNDIRGLVEETIGDWMSMSKSSTLLVQVTYLKPGLLVVEINVLPDGLTDLPSAAHHMHKKMRDGQCDLHYKHHILRPRAESLKAEHVYDHVAEIGDPQPTEPTTFLSRCWGPVRRRPLLVACLISGIVIILIIIITVVLVASKKRRSASYQFKHKKMDNMESFKRNLILSTEWEKPELICKDDVKVSMSDDVEKKPLA